jgi:hypothetical protein
MALWLGRGNMVSGGTMDMDMAMMVLGGGIGNREES